MEVLTLSEVDQGLRCRFTEAQWAQVLGAEGGFATGQSAALPGWALPLDHRPDAGLPADTDQAPASAPVEAPVEVDQALHEAIALGRGAAVQVEVCAVAGDRGVLGVLWCDGRAGAGVVRGVEVRPQGRELATRLRAGVEVSAFGLGGYLGEVMRLVPPAPVTVEATEALVPAELGVGLAQAVQDGDGRVVQALLGALGLEEVPPVVQAAAAMDGTLTVSVHSHGVQDVTVGSWLRCPAGWVELVNTPEEQVRHIPRTARDIEQMLLFDLAGRLDRATAVHDEVPGGGS